MKSPFFHLAGFAAGWAVQAFAHGRATDTAILLSALFFVAHRLQKEIQKGRAA